MAAESGMLLAVSMVASSVDLLAGLMVGLTARRLVGRLARYWAANLAVKWDSCWAFERADEKVGSKGNCSELMLDFEMVASTVEELAMRMVDKMALSSVVLTVT